jgi:hypothetical protein
MVRVLKPDGRFVVSFVNYGSLAVRASRLTYAIERRLWPATRDEKRFWDSPVPSSTRSSAPYRNIGELCGQYLELDRVVGFRCCGARPAGRGCCVPSDRARAERLMERLDGVARRIPGLADFVLMVWRPRGVGETPGTGMLQLPPLSRLTARSRRRRRDD